MASWDVFHADSLELERGLSTAAVRAALAESKLRDDDLVRPAGTAVAWTRLGDIPELAAPGDDALERIEEPAAAPGPREPEPRPEPPSAPSSAPERLRAARPDAASRPGSSDFEVRADQIGTVQPDGPSSTAAPPAWLELGGEPDDVTFPVISDRAGDRIARTPSPPSPDFKNEGPSAPAWDWPDDDDAEDNIPAEPGIAEFDEQIEILDDDATGLEILDEDGLAVPSPYSRESFSSTSASRVALPVVPSRDWNEDPPPVDDGEEGDFTLSRSGPMTVEELDLAPMVDVAFQLVLFFMVTATTVLYKTLEIPKPTNEQAPGAVAQGHSRTMEDLQKDYILVEIDSSGAMKIDREPVAADIDAVAERLRRAREKTDRKVMLLSTDYVTPHRNAVLAYDAAHEIGMSIAVPRPTPPQGPAPSVFPGSARAGAERPAGAAASSPSTAVPPTRAPVPPSPVAGGGPF